MLIDATLRCLAEGSVDRLSVRTIAAEAQVSVGLINHHFPSKDALVAAAYQAAASDLLEGLLAAVEGAPGGPREKLSAFFRDSFSCSRFMLSANEGQGAHLRFFEQRDRFLRLLCFDIDLRKGDRGENQRRIDSAGRRVNPFYTRRENCLRLSFPHLKL